MLAWAWWEGAREAVSGACEALVSQQRPGGPSSARSEVWAAVDAAVAAAEPASGVAGVTEELLVRLAQLDEAVDERQLAALEAAVRSLRERTPGAGQQRRRPAPSAPVPAAAVGSSGLEEKKPDRSTLAVTHLVIGEKLGSGFFAAMYARVRRMHSAPAR